MFKYIDEIKKLIDKLSTEQNEQLNRAAKMLADVIANDGIIHTIGTGHSQMVAMEMFCRASNIANVNTIMDDMVLMAGGGRRSAEIEQVSGLAEILWNNYIFEKSDLIIVISNSGRNALPIEMAMRAKQEGLHVLAITSLKQTHKYKSRHISGKKLYEIADLVIDNGVPSGDGIMKSDQKLIGPASSVLGILIVNTLTTEAIKICEENGVDVPVFQSQNLDEADNDKLYKRFESRIKHL